MNVVEEMPESAHSERPSLLGSGQFVLRETRSRSKNYGSVRSWRVPIFSPQRTWRGMMSSVATYLRLLPREAAVGFGRGALLWLLGVPLPIIILLALFMHH